MAKLLCSKTKFYQIVDKEIVPVFQKLCLRIEKEGVIRNSLYKARKLSPKNHAYNTHTHHIYIQSTWGFLTRSRNAKDPRRSTLRPQAA